MASTVSCRRQTCHATKVARHRKGVQFERSELGHPGSVMRRVPSLLAKLSGPRCHAHPESLASAVCRSCGREVCELCVTLDAGAIPRCLACWRLRALRFRVAAAVVGIIAVGASIMAWRSMNQLPTPTQADRTELPNDSPKPS